MTALPPAVLVHAVSTLTDAQVRALVDCILDADPGVVVDALEEVLSQGAATGGGPRTVIDYEGDTWTLRPNGFYAMAGDADDAAERSLSSIREAYGPLTLDDGSPVPA